MIQTIGVAGAGVMGQGIAALFAQYGYPVQVYDPHPAALDRATDAIHAILAKAAEKNKLAGSLHDAKTRIVSTTDLSALQAHLIVEAAPERLDIKHILLRDIERHNPPSTIIATNTSSISIARIAAQLQHPGRCIGFHFFNPVAVMQLVEVIHAPQTDASLPPLLMELARKLGKQPVLVADAPGFIVNRVARPYYLEAMRIMEESGAEPTTLDAALEAAGFRMGACKPMDLIGVDTNHDVTQRMYEAFFQHARFRPSRLQQQLVDAGRTGKKSGHGWYNYQ